MSRLSRREMLGTAAAATFGGSLAADIAADETPDIAGRKQDRALIAITLDLEMSRNFPTWESTHWDYEKGNLNDETKRYTVEACRRVKAHGGVLHSFVVGQVLEHENVDWLKEIVDNGHPVGNHTYDHVDMLTRDIEKVQWRFQRAPWLIEGKTPAQVVRENIRLCDAALQQRLGVKSNGFRMPGGSPQGLTGRPDLQQMLLELGFQWAGTKNATHPLGPGDGKEPAPEDYAAMVRSQERTQPFLYPSGLIEIPQSAVMDIAAFRYGRWKLPYFLKAIRKVVEWTIEHGAMFDFVGHPSCLYVVDPKFETIELICDLVDQAGDRASIVGLDSFAARARA